MVRGAPLGGADRLKGALHTYALFGPLRTGCPVQDVSQRSYGPHGARAAVRSRLVQPWMTVDHQASQPWLQPCRAHASARWRQYLLKHARVATMEWQPACEEHDPARASRPELGRAVALMSRTGPPAHQRTAQTRLLDSRCAPRGAHWIEADFRGWGGRPQQHAGWFKT